MLNPTQIHDKKRVYNFRNEKEKKKRIIKILKSCANSIDSRDRQILIKWSIKY